MDACRNMSDRLFLAYHRHAARRHQAQSMRLPGRSMSASPRATFPISPSGIAIKTASASATAIYSSTTSSPKCDRRRSLISLSVSTQLDIICRGIQFSSNADTHLSTCTYQRHILHCITHISSCGPFPALNPFKIVLLIRANILPARRICAYLYRVVLDHPGGGC